MTTIRVMLNDQDLTIVQNPLLASGDLETVILHADFSAEWDGYSKTAVFYQNEKNVFHALLNGSGECVIPWEALKAEGVMFFGIFGVKNDTRKTSEVVKYRIKKGAWSEETSPSDPAPDIYTQILSEIAAHAGNKNNPHGVTAQQVGAIPTIKAISDGADLNTYTTPGFYYCISDAKVKEYSNCPTHYAFYLEVGKHAGTFQRLVEYGTQVAKIYFRNLYAGAWGEWQRVYTTMDNPTAAAVGAVSEDVEVLSTTSISDAAIAQANGTVKHYALSGDSYTGADLPSDAYKFSNASVLKRYAMATVVLWGSPSDSRIRVKNYNSGVWSNWCTPFTTTDTIPVSNGGTGATTAAEAIKNINAAPGGYGLGGSAIAYTDLNDATNCGWWIIENSTLNRPFDYGMGMTINRYGSRYTQIAFNPYMNGFGEICVRSYNGTEWLPWEYINPPMYLNKGYRTTERWKGKPVYTILIDCETLPSTGSKSVSTTIPATANIISAVGIAIDSNGAAEPMPIISYNGTVKCSYFMTAAKNININAYSDVSNYTGHIIVKYTID